MADFLLDLGKANLAMGAAIVAVWLLRRPVRALFQAQIGYLLWALVPIAGMACLLPPRVGPALSSAPARMATSILITAAQGTGQALGVPSAGRAAARIPAHAADFQAMLAPLHAFDLWLPLFCVWALGALLMLAYLAKLQARFHAAARRGEAGPAIMGFWRPRLVIPSDFCRQYTAREQAAILAHEQVHLERQDCRVNALAALARCICWFNPVMHLGAGWLRADQELACDAAALDREISRKDYARALLKTQMAMAPLPLGCAWPSSGHPLTERIALLTFKRPGTARRLAGTASVIVAALVAGLGAWAAEPPVPRAPAGEAAQSSSAAKVAVSAQRRVTASGLLAKEKTDPADQTIHITADRNDDDVHTQTVTYTGNVVITRGDIRAHAGAVKFDNRSNKIYASGGVTADSPTAGSATFDNGVYDLGRRLATLSGHVVLSRPGQGTMRGSLVTMNMVTGAIHVSGAPVRGTADRPAAAAMPGGRVETVIGFAGHPAPAAP